MGSGGGFRPFLVVFGVFLVRSEAEHLKIQEKNLTIKDIYGQEVVDAFFKSEGDVMSQQIAVIQAPQVD